MTNIAVRVENLSKLYRIGQIVGYKTLRESLTNVVAAPFRRLRRTGDGRQEIGNSSPLATVSRPANTIWALKDVSFEINCGEVVGIIGRNGSGKTTLLKILSRITAPTEGYVEIHGRVGSLLEVGTGFHPELTGRENIYLNGAILGMKKDEVERKFDEIVAFSEVEKFLDTPIKRYSSGMYVRLAFAVAAHLEPDILLVDEVLAVGDIGFQRKCIAQMDQIQRQGRTIIFVSHNMTLLRPLCQVVYWLDEGRLKMSGEAHKVISQYEMDLTSTTQKRGDRLVRNRPASSSARIDWVQIHDTNGEARTNFEYGELFDIIASLGGNLPPAGYLEWYLRSLEGTIVTSGGTFMRPDFKLPTASGRVCIRIGPISLAEGSYVLSLKLGILPGYVLDEWESIEKISIIKCVPEPGGPPFDSRRGSIFIPAKYFDPGRTT